jgi:hypothetical protein
MRFLLGLLGSWAGLMIATLIISSMDGSLHSYDVLGVGTLNLIFAAVTATIVAFIEKPTWTWVNYAITGALTSGVLLFALFILIGMSLASAMGGSINFGIVAFLATTITCGISGALSGVGYRTLSGKLAAE